MAEETVTTTPESISPSSTTPPATNPEVTPPAQPPANDLPQWLDWIKDDTLKSSSVVKNLQSHKEPEKAFAELLKQHVNVQPLIGRGAPKPNATDEEVLQFRQQYAPKTIDEYAMEPSDDPNAPVLPDVVNDLIKDIANDRKLTKSDYQSIYTKLNQYLGNRPQECNQYLVEKYGKDQASTINQSYENAMNLVPDQFRDEAKQVLGNNPLFREIMTHFSGYFNESSMSGGTNMQEPQTPTNPQASSQQLQTEVQKLNASYLEVYNKYGQNKHHPDVMEASKKLNEKLNLMTATMQREAMQKRGW